VDRPRADLAAVVVGATGAVGSALVRELLASPAFTRVTALTRRPFDGFSQASSREKLRVEVIDLADLEQVAARLAAGFTTAFCTLGVGQPRKVAPAEVWKIDVEYAGAFARGARAAGVAHISLLSSVGADVASRARYLHVKGAAEAAVVGAGIARTSLFRPSLLVTRELRYGLQDRITQAVYPRISWALPSRFHEIRVEDLGAAMRVNAERPGAAGTEILQYAEVVSLLESRRLDGVHPR